MNGSFFFDDEGVLCWLRDDGLNGVFGVELIRFSLLMAICAECAVDYRRYRKLSRVA